MFSVLALSGCTEPGDPWYYVEPDGPGGVNSDVVEELPEIDPSIQQIFNDHGCVDCHGGSLTLGGLNLTSMGGLVTGGALAGPSIVACDPDASPLVQVLEGGIDDGTIRVSPMPKGGTSLSADTVQSVRDWIAAGAGLETCDDDGGGTGPEPEVSFEDDILPIFEGSSCMSCHGNGATSGGLDLSSTESLLTGGAKAGPSVIPCDSSASPLVMVVEEGWSSGDNEVGVMPPFGDLLSNEDVATIRSWIDAGAGQTSCGDDPGDDPGDDSSALWTDEIRPLMETQCGACHTTSGYGSPKFLDDEATLDGPANHSSCEGQTVAECIYTRMADGTMPLGLSCDDDPMNEGCPTEEELQQVKDWVDAGALH
jgi:mono/diheme cytochrome c family protein